MPATKTYDYQSIDHDGKRTKGKIEASNELAAAQLLRQQGLTPLAITDADTLMRRDIRVPGLGDRTSLKDLSVFSRQFATMAQSGMSLLRSLAVLEEQAQKESLKKAIGEVRLDIEGGMSLSGALGKHPKVFPALMVAMIRAGETGGFLDSALDRIATNFEKDAQLRGKIKSALTYPVIVLIFTAVMISAVLIFIVPIFEKMFKQLGGELPLPTQIIVNASHTLFWLGPLVIAVLVVSTVTLRKLMAANPAVRLRVDRIKLRLPVFGPLFTKIALSRFSRNLGTLLGVGVPVLQALDVVGATTGNAVISNAMADLQTAVREGRPMSSQLGAHKVFPSMVVQMVEVGEESGQISQMLEKIADFYDREVDSAADALTASIEPIMVLVMGGVVGGMIICLYLPMFSIYQNIQSN
ncbi:type II secretion system F family protein [Dactylosporangium aurantiacum]|uniref:Type II secretion system F family protein n=1 Tax=Dactylosporangium aurantiacum TaxID=35754 RepID=A0A9Q9MT66_9ACTN|nr:type II secretion system F family protein [Dactylosporangium aurantiacum]MDG6102237.1 type II secretion system F family protein [Dactylosporangium aurantiacum]UWZ60102.1 type II secretion system F family protein [Dactylosporangium aurantiacum]